MSWDAWALLSIIALCLTVIARTCWDSYRVNHPGNGETLRLSLSTGGYLDIPCRPTHSPGRHRSQPSR